MDSTKNYFDDWIQAQGRMLESLTQLTKQYQESFWKSAPRDGGAQALGAFSDLYSSWTNAFLNALRETASGDGNPAQGPFSRGVGGSRVFERLYEIWLPLMKAVQDRSLSPETYRELMDPKKYKEVLDKIFGFDADAVLEPTAQSAKFMEAWAGAAQQFMRPWVEAAGKTWTTLPHIVEGRPEAYMQSYNTMFNAFDSTYGRIFHIPPIGKDREKVKLFLGSFDDLSVYLARYTEYQYTIYITGLSAMEKVVAKITEQFNKGEEIRSFDEFFDLWLDVNEETYYELFRSEDFSKMQGKMLEASVTMREHNFKLMELYLYDYPIAVRSEMDDLYKTIYELKKKVKDLEKQFREVNA
jgi:hypothetical protein